MGHYSRMFSHETLVDPFDFYQEVHGEGTKVAHIPEMNTFIVFSYDLCAEATGRPEVFSNDFGSLMAKQDAEIDAILAEGWDNPPTLLTADHPVHTRNRKLVNLAFSAPRVNAIEADMRAKSIELIESIADKGECEFVEAFAIPLPVAMIAQQIGLDNDPKQVKYWSDCAVDRFSQMIDREREIECARSFVEYQKYMKGKIDDRRANGGDDLLTDLVEARIEGETPLTDEEIMSIMQQFMVAGNETTTSTLAGGLLQLIRNPDQMAKARAAAGGRDPKLMLNLVEESLRYETPSAGMWRIVKEDAELGGVKIPKGSTVQLRYAAANRDPGKFPDPDKFDIERSNAKTHLAFGRGPHMCVGNMLSRKEVFVAFDELLNRLDDFAISDESGIAVLPNILLRGVTRLPITFRRAG
jgi:cytochrome P450